MEQTSNPGPALDGALGTLPAAPPAPEQLPEPPPVPLSYLWDLGERMGQPQPLTHAQQHQILIQLQPALRSADPEEREAGRYVRKMFSGRDDLYADVERTLAQLELADHLDVAARLEQATRTAQRRKALVDEMTALHNSGQWDAVVAAAQELAGLDPEHPDPGGIVSDAKANLFHANLAEWYGQAWAEAAELFTAIGQQQPGDRDAAALVKDAEQQRRLAAWLDQAEAAAGLEDWDAAVTALKNLCAIDPAYRDAAALLERARSARSVKQLVDEMTALHQAGRWKEVLAAAEKLARLDPEDPDPGGIVSDAQAKIGDAALAEQYAQALNHLDQHRWQQAAELFTAIEQQHPGYRDAAALVKDAEQKRQLAAWFDQAKAAAGREDWDTAVTALEHLCAVDPAYRGAGARLERARSARSLTHEQQREIIDRLERALASADPQERQVARHLLDRFSGRQDLHQDISETVAQWRMELPAMQGEQPPHLPQVPKAARYSGWVALSRRLPSIRFVVAVAAVVVAVVLVGVLSARDSGSISTPATSETKAPIASESKTSESPVDPSSPASGSVGAQGALQGFLLSAQQINTAMGASGMTVTGYSVVMSDRSATIEPKECLGIDGSAQSRVYAGSHFTAERSQTLQEGYKYTPFVEQAVVLFPSAKQANAFFTTSAQQWPACHQYAYTWPKSQWTVGAISNTNGTLSTIATQQNANAPSGGCGRALALRNNAVIDVTTCSANPADSAVTIANQIAAKVPS